MPPRFQPLRNRLRLLGLLAAAAVATPALATVMSGQVTSDLGSPIAGVDIDFIDRATGTSIPLVGDRTDALGLYAVTVPPGSYDVQFEPPVGMRFVAAEQPNVPVAGVSGTLDQVLRSGWLLSATVVDPALVPQPSVRLSAAEQPSGTLVYSPYAGSDAAGFVQIVVPSGSFDLLFDPPGNGPLLPEALPGVVVNADLALGAIMLRRGLHLTGRIMGEDGPALAGVRVSAVDPATGLTVANGSALTDLLGAYELWLDAGILRLDAVPGAGSTYLPRSLHGLDLATDLSLPDIALDRGVLADGLVVDSFGAGVPDVDLDVDNPYTGRRVPTLRDNTDAAGRYEVVLRPGRYDVSFDPPAGTLASARLLAQDIPVDTTLPTIVLAEGFHLTGRVLEPGGSGAAGVDIDVILEASGVELSTPLDDTDVRGDFDLVVPTGSYRVEFDPPAGSGWGAAVRTGVAIAAADVDLGVIPLGVASPATSATLAPNFGPDTGGTSVTITGTGFEMGARASVGGMRLRNVVVSSATSLQGVTDVHHPALVDALVTNPGATALFIADAYEYVQTAPDALIKLRLDGPLLNDILVEWSAIGQPTHRVFRSDGVHAFGEPELLDAVSGTRYRDEGGLLQPGLIFYIVR